MCEVTNWLIAGVHEKVPRTHSTKAFLFNILKNLVMHFYELDSSAILHQLYIYSLLRNFTKFNHEENGTLTSWFDLMWLYSTTCIICNEWLSITKWLNRTGVEDTQGTFQNSWPLRAGDFSKFLTPTHRGLSRITPSTHTDNIVYRNCSWNLSIFSRTIAIRLILQIGHPSTSILMNEKGELIYVSSYHLLISPPAI